MSVNVSIILICHNKYPQNLFTLYSLQKQKYNHSQMEVIFVDDNSTDQTSSLQKYTGPFRFKYFHSKVSLGRAGAKNLGMKMAEGKIVIFLDGEIMVDQNFVANHLRHYRQEERIAVSGTSSHYCTFSVLYPNFTPQQIEHIYSIIKNEPYLLKLLEKRLGVPYAHLRNYKLFRQFAEHNRKLIPLLTKEDIDRELYKRYLSFPLPSFPQVYKKFDARLTGYHLPWTFFITRNVSVAKSLLDAVGPFNEVFNGWGYEDWELGFRLYKQGVKFLEDRDICSYHQEHPFSTQERKKDQMQNYTAFVNLHPEIEVCALTLDLLGKKSLLQVNDIITDYYLLEKEFPHQYIHVKNAFIKLTQQIPLLLSGGRPVTRILLRTGMTEGARKKLYVELASLRKTGKYAHLLNAYTLLLNL